jgi:hypothetical protein
MDRRSTLRRAGALLLVLLLLAPAGALAGEEEVAPPPPEKGEGKAYGKELTESDIVPISKLLAAPDEFVGEQVKVEGRIVGVCAKRGCWMELAGDEEFQSMRIKVDDGVIVFPMEAKGHLAVAEGVFTKIELTLEQTQKMAQHECEERGEKYDAANVTEPGVIYQIAGLGAVIF